jgi:hypothetical protein
MRYTSSKLELSSSHALAYRPVQWSEKSSRNRVQLPCDHEQVSDAFPVKGVKLTRSGLVDCDGSGVAAPFRYALLLGRVPTYCAYRGA